MRMLDVILKEWDLDINAIQKVCEETNTKLNDFDLIEINEAFGPSISSLQTT